MFFEIIYLINITMDQNILDDIISKLNAEDVSIDYLIMGVITDYNGIEKVFRGLELEEMLKNPKKYKVSQIQVVMNIKKIRKDLEEEIKNLHKLIGF